MTHLPVSSHGDDDQDMLGGVSKAGRSRARRAALERIGELGVNRKELADRAKLSRNTVQTFLDGSSWPRELTLAQLDRALGWAPGTLKSIALSDEVTTQRSAGSSRSPLTNITEAAVWVTLLTTEERDRMSPSDYAEATAAGTAESLKRWREIDASRANRRGNNADGQGQGR